MSRQHQISPSWRRKSFSGKICGDFYTIEVYKSRPPHYFWLICALGSDYDPIWKEKFNFDGDYASASEVDVELVSEKIEAMLN